VAAAEPGRCPEPDRQLIVFAIMVGKRRRMARGIQKTAEAQVDLGGGLYSATMGFFVPARCVGDRGSRLAHGGPLISVNRQYVELWYNLLLECNRRSAGSRTGKRTAGVLKGGKRYADQS
jgi:hypothetical protein